MKQISFAVLFFICVSANAQRVINRDPEIEKMVSEISSDSLKRYVTDLVAFGTRNTLSTQTSATRGIGAAKLYVMRQMLRFGAAAGGRMSVIHDTITLQPDKRRVDTTLLLGNVVATLRGTDPNDKRIFIMSGHLDNMRTNVMDRVNDAPGANDDASGVAALMECARIMSKRQFPATVIFIAFSGEEQGLLGAQFHARVASEKGMEIEAVLNNDIMGSNNSNGTRIIDNTILRVFSEGLPAFETEKTAVRIRQLGLENDGKSRQLARYVKEIGERYVDNLTVKLMYRSDRFLRGGDHTPFLQRGFTAVRITEGNENYEHQHQDVRVQNGIQYGDLPEFMDFEYLRKNTGVNLATLCNLASASSVPQKAVVDVSALSNFTKLSWEKPAIGNESGYYVLLRETSTSQWEKKIFTKELSATLPYSKDNYFFAVQTVDEKGHESLPVVFLPKQ